MHVPTSQPSRLQRRAGANRSQRMHSFSRSGRRHAQAALMMSLLPLGLSHPAHAQKYTLTTGTNHGTYLLGTDTPGNGGSYDFLNGTSGTVDILDATSLVHGPYGYIGDGGATEIINQGIIESEVNGGAIHMRSTSFGNTGTIKAINGGTLYLESTLDNTGGILNVDAASAFNISGVTVTGGQSTGAGVLSLAGTTLSAFTANSGLSVATATVTNGLTLNRTAAVSGNLALSDSTVSGTGDISLGTTTPGSGNGYAILNSNGNAGNTIGAGITVHGPNGYIGDGGALLTNNGLISSDVSGGQLTLRSTTFANKTTIQAINGGTISLQSAVNNGTNGILNVDGTSTFNISGVTVTGGQSTGVGVLSLAGTTLSAFTANSGLSVATATVTNGLTLNRTATVSGDLYLTDSAVTTTGTGDISLGTSIPNSGNGYAILHSNGTTGNTIGSGVTVHGPNGYIGDGGALFTNSGLISSDVNGGQLTLRSTTFANKATIQAVGGGTLNLDANLTNTGAGRLVADAASTFNINGVTVTGGQSSGVGAFNLNGTTLSAFTANSGLSVATATVTNGLTLNRTAAVSGNLALSDSTVSGTGGISLGTTTPGGGNGYAILSSNGTTGNAIGSGVTVHGPNGYIGDGGVTLTNQGLISSDVSGGQLTLRNNSVANQGTTQAINGGTLYVTTPFMDTGTVKAGAGSTVNFDRDLTQSGASSQTIADGAISINNGNGTLTVTGGTVKGTGTINGSVAVTGGDVAPGDSPGTLAVAGNYTQTGGALDIEYTASRTGPTAHDLLTVSGTATVGGVLNISFLGPSVNGVYLATAGEPGTTFDFLTFGTLGNTNGLAGLFTNEYSIGGSYFVNGIPQDSVAGVPAQYRLTFDPNNSKALQLSLTTTATPEPSQWAAFGLGTLGLVGLGGRARRRHS